MKFSLTKFILLILFAAVAAGIYARYMFPWKPLLESKIIAVAEAEGFKNVSLKIADVDLQGITLKDVSIGAENPLRFDNLTIGYSLQELREGKLKTLSLSGLKFDAQNKGSGWKIAGLDDLGSGDAAAKIKIPVSSEELAEVGVDSADINNSSINADSGSWHLEAPMKIDWQKYPVPKLTLESASVKFVEGEIRAELDKFSANITLDENKKQWQGQWQASNIMTNGTKLALPTLTAKGAWVVGAESVAANGRLVSADSSYNAEFSLSYFLNVPEKSQVEVSYASFPWNGGMISTKDVSIPLIAKRGTDVNLSVQKVSIGELMKALTGERASGTGIVSGVLPITITADGKIMVHEAKLQSEEPGVIAMQPEAIPGDNPQVALVRDIMKNLHYNLLAIAINSGDGNKLTVSLSIEGSNPDVQKGKPVKLNVNLTGDVLDLIQQSVMTIVDPKTLLKQGENEKK